MEVLPVILLPVGHDGFGLPEFVQHDDQLAALDLLDFSRQKLAHLRGELLPDPGPLAFAHPLDDPLFGRLNRQPAKVDKRNLFLEHVAHLEVGIFVLRLFQGDLRAGIFHRLHHLAETHHLDGTLQLIDAELEADVGAEFATKAA